MTDERDRLTLTLDWPEITLDALARVSALWTDFVREVTRRMAGRTRRGVKWVIRDVQFSSPLRITADPVRVSRKIDPLTISAISHAVIEGVNHIQQYPDVPPMFSESALGKLRQLARQSDPQQDRRIFVSNGHDEKAPIGTRIIANVDRIFGPTTESYGTVEGRLEGVFVHGARRFYIYDSLSNRQVRCEFGERIPLAKILDAFERRVSASGMVRSRALTGERISVQVHDFRVFPLDSELPSTDRILELWRDER